MNEINRQAVDALGKYLEQGRQEAGLTVRQLATASGIPKSTVSRILKGEVEHPSAEHVQHLVHILELNEADAFAYIGVTPTTGLPSVAPYLRQKHGLEGIALSEAAEQIQKIIEKYNTAPPDK